MKAFISNDNPCDRKFENLCDGLSVCMNENVFWYDDFKWGCEIVVIQVSCWKHES